MGEGATVGDNTVLMAGAYIGNEVRVGQDCMLHPGVHILYGCEIGNRCIIHAGAVIGSEGFGFAPQPDGTFIKVPQTGNVVIEDEVEVGANTTIDRATMGSTFIRRGLNWIISYRSHIMWRLVKTRSLLLRQASVAAPASAEIV